MSCGLCKHAMTERERLSRELEVNQRIQVRRVLDRIVIMMSNVQVGELITEARRILARAERLPVIGLGGK